MGRVLVQQPGTNTAKALTETLPKNVIIVDEDLKELRLHDGVTPGGKIIGQGAGSGVPVGTLIPFAGNYAPQGYLLCDGSAISRTDYASLFAVIGTTYGAGDGNSTFNLPTQSVLVLGTSAPLTVSNNVAVRTPVERTSVYSDITGNIQFLSGRGSFPYIILANGGVASDPMYAQTTAIQGSVNLANTSGANAIVCIKY